MTFRKNNEITTAPPAPRKRKSDGKEKVKAIRKECLDCCKDSAPEVRACPTTNCPLWNFRLREPVKDAPGKPMNRRAAIREKCLDCSADNKREITNCRITKCFLYPYRPFQQKKRAGTDSVQPARDTASNAVHMAHFRPQNGLYKGGEQAE